MFQFSSCFKTTVAPNQIGTLIASKHCVKAAGAGAGALDNMKWMIAGVIAWGFLHTNIYLAYSPNHLQKIPIAKGMQPICSRVHSRFCSLPNFICSLYTPKNTHNYLHTPWPITTMIIPIAVPWYPSCNGYRCTNKCASDVINGGCGGTSACYHVYGHLQYPNVR